MWLSAFSLGNFVGPTIAGAIVQAKGYRFTTLVFFILFLLMFVIDVMEAIFREIKNAV